VFEVVVVFDVAVNIADLCWQHVPPSLPACLLLLLLPDMDQ
jgi:hypothetical protein